MTRSTTVAAPSAPVLELLEARLLLDAGDFVALLGQVPASAGEDSTGLFAWGGFERAEQAEAPQEAMAWLEFGFQGTPTLDAAEGAWVVALEGEQSWANSGDPIVPIRPAQILLPRGAEIVSVDVELGEAVEIARGVDLLAEPAPRPPVGQDGDDGGDGEGGTAQPAEGAFPGEQAVRFSTHTLAGYSIGLLQVFPVHYDADDGVVLYYPSIRATVTTAPSPAAPTAPQRDNADDAERVLDAVLNDSALHEYAAGGDASMAVAAAGDLPGNGPFEYVVITSASLADSFERLVEHKRSRGLSATVVTTEYICSHFNSPYANENDSAGKVRQFIAEAYASWQTRWVLLGGDTPTVPDRRVLAVSNTYRYTITSDMYFACLDGPWNGEPDAAWAQNDDGAGGGDVDLAPEVFVGRAPVDTPDEADHFIDKTILYETTAPPNPTTGLSLGELLTNWPATWGGETNDYALSTAPADVEIIRLHEKLAPYGKQDVIDQLNASPNIVTHNGHSSFATSAKLLRSDVDALTNAHPYIAYSQGCNSGQFERSDAIAEHELKGPGGAVAGVWNTSLGWYSPGNPRGSGTKWAYDFWEAMFVENILRIGEAHFDAKMDRIALVSPNGGTGRWMHLTSTLFGDPELRLFLPLEGGSFVTGQSPSGITGPGVDRLRLEFAEPMDVSSFSLAEDLLSFEGPGGVDLSGQVTGFVWRDFFTLDILFQPQRAAGTYQLTIGPDVLDCSGRPMDQNRDGIAADGPSDGYQATFSFAASGSWATAYAEYLDFAPDWSLDPGVGDARWQWGRPTGQQGDPTSGYSGDNVVGYNLNGTYAPNTPAEYATTPPIDCSAFSGLSLSYREWLRIQGRPKDHASVEISTNGQTWTTLWHNGIGSMYGNSWTLRSIDISAIADHQSAVWIRWSLGPTDAFAQYGGWNLDDVIITGQRTYPRVTAHGPTAAQAGLDHVDVTFATPIDPATFGVADVSLTGPGGAVSVTGVGSVADNTYRLSFAPQWALGSYTLTVGPDVANAAGKPMDQDNDGGPGEAGQDAYVGVIELAAPDADPPRVLSDHPFEPREDAKATWMFVFDEPMDTVSFSLTEDLVSFTGPAGDLRQTVTGFRWIDDSHLEILFNGPGEGDVYAMTVGPGILDAAGNPMDQNGDGIAGGAHDAYTAWLGVASVDLAGQSLAMLPENLVLAAGLADATFTVQNRGDTDSGPFTIRFYLSDDAVIDPAEDMALTLAGGAESYVVAGLPADAAWSDTVGLLTPPGDPFATDGRYYVGMVVDADGQVAETDESNNAGTGVSVDTADVFYGRLFGTVWHDRDADGSMDAGEQPMSDMRVWLDADDDGSLDGGEMVAVTGTDGSYVFTGVPDGPHAVRLWAAAGWLVPSHRVVLEPGGIIEGVDFGLYQPARVAGEVFLDADADGQRDAGEQPLAGWAVYVDLNGSGRVDPDEPSALTGADGTHVLPDLAPGQQAVRLDLPTGWMLTCPAGGAYELQLGEGQSAAECNFGAAPASALIESVEVARPAPGLQYAYYRHDGLASVDALDGLLPRYAGVVGNFDRGVRDRNEDYAFVYTGFIHVQKDGFYTFFAATDDAMEFHVCDTLVVDADGQHLLIERSGVIGLRAGFHPIVLKLLHTDGDGELSVSWHGPGGPQGGIPDVVLFRGLPPVDEGFRPTSAASANATQVLVTFNSEADAASAVEATNFVVDGGVTVRSAHLQPNGRAVLLNTSPLADQTEYALAAPGVFDTDGQVTETDAVVRFTHRTSDPAVAAWWTFDESDGDVAADAAGGDDAAVLLNGASIDPGGGLRRGAMLLDGNDDFALAGDSDRFDGASALTISVHVNARRFYSAPLGVVTKRTSSTVNNAYSLFFINNVLYVEIDGPESRFHSVTHFDTDRWYHIVLVYDGTREPDQRVCLYVNGEAEVTAREASSSIPNYPSELALGLLTVDYQHPFVGMLDDVQIIRRALSEAEVAALSVGNDAPDVMADTYLLEPGQSLAIDADDGVLRNDSDRNGNDLTASVATGPAGGGLTLSEDGSFQYTPLPGFYGLDSFTYRADDGVTDETATVDLWVALPADANLDRIVDANDYARTRDSFGAQEAGWIDGDFNLDGRVDVPDYLILKANYGRTYDVGLSEAGGGSDSAAGTDASSPPEPAPPTQTEAPLPAPTDAESQPIPPAVDASPLTAAALDDPPALPADPPAADALTEPTPLEVASAGPSSARVRSRRIDADPPFPALETDGAEDGDGSEQIETDAPLDVLATADPLPALLADEAALLV